MKLKWCSDGNSQINNLTFPLKVTQYMILLREMSRVGKSIQEVYYWLPRTGRIKGKMCMGFEDGGDDCDDGCTTLRVY